MAASINENEQLCNGCKEDGNLVSWLLDGTDELQFQWHRELEDIRSNQGCGFCTMIAQLIPADIPNNVSLRFQKSESTDPAAPVKEFRSLSVEAWAPGIVRELGHVGIAGQHEGYCWSQGKQGVAELDLDNEMDLGRVKGWLKRCASYHHHLPLDTPRYTVAMDITLIDVQNYRIIESKTTERYVALSYVWGGAVDFTTTTKNRKDLKLLGSLKPEHQRLPTTIRDAIELVRGLDESFLWVDALCIDQDQDNAQKLDQISMMDIVYSQAYLTIIAQSAETAASPLPGIRTGTRIRQARGTVHGVELEIIRPNAYTTETFYSTRGWTLQEEELSTRRLYMNNHNAAFLCNSIEVNDQTGCRVKPYLLKQNYPLDLILNKQRKALDYHSHLLESFEEYGEAVTRYRKRDLSFQTDMLNAFGGMLGLLQDHIGGNVIGGIPEPLIDIGILWGHPTGLVRLPGFPSWSWAGWEYFLGSIEPIAGMEEDWAVPFSIKREVRDLKWNLENTRTGSVREWTDFRVRNQNSHTTGGVNGLEGNVQLCFSAFSVPLNSSLVPLANFYFTNTSLGSSLHYYIIDTEDRVCGRHCSNPCGGSTGPYPDDLSPEDHEYILLSRFKPDDTEAEKEGYLQMNLDSAAYPFQHGFCLNIMLVRKIKTDKGEGEKRERVYVGQIHESAWLACDRTEKQITLC